MSKTLLIVPGLPRCATTSLVNLLYQHPEVFQSPVKEPHFFLSKILDEDYYIYDGIRKRPYSKSGFLLSEVLYRKNFQNFTCPKKCYIDGSTLYSVHYRSIAEIKKWVDQDWNVKFVVCTREPFDRAVSHYKFSKSRAEEPREFGHALKEEIDGNDKWLLGGYIKGSSENMVVAEIKKHFGEDSLKIIDIEGRNVFTPALMKSVCQFAGLAEYKFDFNVYDNSSDEIGSATLGAFRIWLRRIRAVNPLLFDNALTRRFFRLFMAFAKSNSKQSVKSDENYNDYREQFYFELDRLTQKSESVTSTSGSKD